MSGRLPQTKPEACIRALEKLGFVVRKQTGSHVILRHPLSGRITSVPHHSGDIKRGLLYGIIRQAGLSVQEFIDLL